MWTVTFVVAGLVRDARAQPAPPQDAPAPEPVAAPPEPVATPPVAPSSGPSPLDPTSPVERRRRPAYFVAHGGVDFGGDEIVRINGTTSMETINAGERYSVSGGVVYSPDPNWWVLEATIGYKWQSRDLPGGTVGISRFPLDVIASVTASGFRFGGGVTVHFSPSSRIKTSDQHVLETTLDDAIGGILQLAYHFGDERGLDLGVRGTYIQYGEKGEFDGTCYGFFMGVWL
jgi:hypothetical protein